MYSGWKSINKETFIETAFGFWRSLILSAFHAFITLLFGAKQQKTALLTLIIPFLEPVLTNVFLLLFCQAKAWESDKSRYHHPLKFSTTCARTTKSCFVRYEFKFLHIWLVSCLMSKYGKQANILYWAWLTSCWKLEYFRSVQRAESLYPEWHVMQWRKWHDIDMEWQSLCRFMCQQNSNPEHGILLIILSDVNIPKRHSWLRVKITRLHFILWKLNVYWMQ